MPARTLHSLARPRKLVQPHAEARDWTASRRDARDRPRTTWRPTLVLGLLLHLALAGGLMACGGGGRYIVIGTAKAPSTSGVMEVDDLDGGSSLVTIHMEHLPPPQQLTEAFEAYVVWFEGPNGETIRAGELSYDPDARTGDLSETSPLSEFTIKITAEQDKHSSVPSAFLVASQQVRAE